MTDAEVDDARAKAEARRRRILEKANKRMEVVSGEHAIGDEEKKQSNSNAARIRAARQKRYGKKTHDILKQEDEKVQEKVEETVQKVEAEPSAQTGSENTVGVEAPGVARKANNSEAEFSVGPDREPAGPAQEVPNENDDERKKKYLGVAKMRRKMVMKKKAAQEQEASKGDLLDISAIPSESIKPTVVAARAIPVVMYAVTILLMFAAGFDFGFQQYHEQVTVHVDPAIRRIGLHFKNDLPRDKGIEDTLEAPLLTEETGAFSVSGMNDNEFDDLIIESDVNIDPLFGVDLDELTKGPGLLFTLARGAVAAHRFLLRLFYFGPRNIVHSLFELPLALVQLPPVLCCVAILVRQVIGKSILKAELPSAGYDEKDPGIDVLSMVKNGVTNLLSSTFPTAVVVYSAFIHIRSDMYVIIFGAMCGMAWADTLRHKGAGNNLFPEEHIPEEEIDMVTREL